MDFLDRFERLVRGALRLDEDPDSLPRVDRLAMYRATVRAAASDGSTVDVEPEDSRIESKQGVPLRAPFPGAVVVVQPGAAVLLGWVHGDPAQMYAEPSWENGAATKIVIKATTVYLGDETGAEPLVKRSEFNAHTHPVAGVTAGMASVTSAIPAPVSGTSQVQGK